MYLYAHSTVYRSAKSKNSSRYAWSPCVDLYMSADFSKVYADYYMKSLHYRIELPAVGRDLTI
jgi:hypothetical protein